MGNPRKPKVFHCIYTTQVLLVIFFRVLPGPYYRKLSHVSLTVKNEVTLKNIQTEKYPGIPCYSFADALKKPISES
jgi:hypothetical protein